MIQNPCRMWDPRKIRYCMYTCIILHNMILKDEGHAICPHFHEEEIPNRSVQQSSEARQRTILQLRDREVYHHLRYDLTEHIHNRYIHRLDGEDHNEDHGDD